MSNLITVGISDMKLARASGGLITYALGSCVGVCIYDPNSKLAGMIHIMLPVNMSTPVDNIFKYASTGIPEMIRKMTVFGGNRATMYAKIAGGAKMFETAANSTIGNIGQRNIESVKTVLEAEKIRIVKEDVGLNYARTLTFFAENGEARIKAFGRPEIVF